MKIIKEDRFRIIDGNIKDDYNIIRLVIDCEKKSGEHIKLKNFVQNFNKPKLIYENNQRKYYLDNDYYEIYLWEEFKEKYYHYCSRCDSWQEDQCICYTR